MQPLPEEEDGRNAQRRRRRVLAVAGGHEHDERRKREDQRRGVDAVDVVGPVGHEVVTKASRDLKQFPRARRKPASDPAEQQRREGRSGEVGCRDEREREGEGQVGGALEAKLNDGKTQEPGLESWRQRHEREEKEQVQQEQYREHHQYHYEGGMLTKVLEQCASPGDLDVLLHHRLRQQLLGFDLDSVLESLAPVVAVEELLGAGLVVLDARGSRQLQPSEEDLVFVGCARVA
eukprot:scaffold16944_cov60-Phaeocystis_antarctica.AAC.2